MAELHRRPRPAAAAVDPLAPRRLLPRGRQPPPPAARRARARRPTAPRPPSPPGSLSTIFGAAGFWEPVIGLPVLLVGEVVTREYYLRPAERRPVLLKLANALKVGFYLGIVIDALKLAG